MCSGKRLIWTPPSGPDRWTLRRVVRGRQPALRSEVPSVSRLTLAFDDRSEERSDWSGRILAGAGSGKTTTIKRRIANQVRTGAIAAQSRDSG